MILLPNAAGIAAYHLNQFTSAKAAELFLDSSRRDRAPEGSVMFWALTWQPTLDAATEPLVLIRDTIKPTIYPFSFSDIDSAFEFVRHEMHRGLHLSQVMIYWALPAHIEVDFWGRSTIQPAEAPAGLTVIPTSIAEPVFSGDAAIETAAPNSAVIEGEGARYLADDDIAETVRQAAQAASKSPPPDAPAVAGRVVPMPVAGPSRKSKRQETTQDASPIDFPSASQKVQQGRLARAAITTWRNFALAVDEALDVYVARRVATKLAWNRITRALGQAIDAQQQAEIESAERKALEEAKEARLEASRPEEARPETHIAHQKAWRQAWLNASRAIGEAHRVSAARRHMFEKAWSEGATQIRAAVHVRQRLIRVRTGLNNLSIAIEEAIEVNAYGEDMIEAWNAITDGLLSAANAKQNSDRSITAWANGSFAIGEMLHAFLVQRTLIRFWRNAGRAIAEAVAMHLFKKQSIVAWTTAAISIKEALVADALLRIKQAGLDRKQMSGVENAVKATVTGARTKTTETAEAGNGTCGKKTAAAAVSEEVEEEVRLAPPPLLIGEVKMPAEFLPDEVAEEATMETMPPVEGEFAEALLAAVDAVNLDEDEEPFDEKTPDVDAHAPLFPALWRSHDAGRWQPRSQPFDGFESPQGKF